MFELAGKGALVTGASGGIGGDIARALHAQGATVALSGTRGEALEALRAELKERAACVTCDLGVPAEVDALPGRAAQAVGTLDLLIHCAGLTRDGLALRMKDDDWHRVIDVNMSAGFRLARAALRDMMKRRYGRIIFITSIVGATGNPGQSNYAAAKAGLTGLAKALAAEVASRNITVNCVAPGFIKTPMTDALNDEQRQRLLQAIPSGRFGVGADVAAACVFLASAEAGYITGQTLHVNGGMAMF